MKALRFSAADSEWRVAGKGIIVMATNVEDIIKKLSPARHKKVEAMGGSLSLVAEFPDRPPVVLCGIADDESRA